MFSRLKLNLATAFILFCLFGSTANAQLASNKSLHEIYNKKINEKLNEKDKSKDLSKSIENSQDMASSNPSLRNVANLKIKNPEIIAHSRLVQPDSTPSNEQKKNNLPSNSTKIKQMGKPAKPQKFHSQ